MELEGLAAVLALSARDIERLSVLLTARPLVVHADSGAVDGRELAAALRRIPTVTVLVGEVAAELASAFDVCLSPDADAPSPYVPGGADDISVAIDAHPLACLGLVALLRSADPADVWGALAAESATYATLLGGRDFRRWLRGRAARTSDGPAVRLERERDQLTITLDRPDVHNAFNRAMRDELVEALELVADDRGIGEVVLRGEGPSFCSGGDLAEFGTVDDPPTAHAVRLTRHPGWWMHVCADRIVARIHGACIGAGIELPAFASRVEAAPDAACSLPEVSMGLIPGAGGTVSITRRIGRQRLAWMALTGQSVGATTARRWGLIDEVVDAPDGRAVSPG